MNDCKHLNTKESYFTEDGGLVHIFEDGSHTYIEPCIVQRIVVDYMHLTFKIPIKYEEE